MQQQYMDTLLRVERQNQKIEQQLKMLSLKLRVKEDFDKTIQTTMENIYHEMKLKGMEIDPPKVEKTEKTDEPSVESEKISTGYDNL